MKTFTVYWWNAKGTKRHRRSVKAKTARAAAMRIFRKECKDAHLNAGLDVYPA